MKRIQAAVDRFITRLPYGLRRILQDKIFSYPRGYATIWDPCGERHGCVMNMRCQQPGASADEWVYYPRVKWRAKELPKPIPLPGFGKDRIGDAMVMDYLERHT